MTTPSRPPRGRRASMSSPPMLSWFCATDNGDPEEKTDLKERKRNKKAKARSLSLSLSATTATKTQPSKSNQQEPAAVEVEKLETTMFSSKEGAPTKTETPKGASQATTNVPPPAPESSPENMMDQLEIEITGLELLRRDDSWDTDSFSYESYARDSYARPQKGSQHYTTKSSPYHQQFSRRNSASNRQYSSRHERRGSMESGYSSFAGASFANDSMDGMRRRNSCSNPRGNYPQHQKTLSRRSSTGTATNDLPGFEAYKEARRKSSMGHATNFNNGESLSNSLQTSNEQVAKSFTAARRAYSLGAGTPNSPMILRGGGGGRRDSLGSRRSSIGSRRSSIGSRRSSIGSGDKDAFLTNNSSHNGSYSRRMSLGSSCNSGGGRPRI